MTNVESTDNVRDFLEEESQVDGLDNKKNPFQKWAEDIFKKSQEKIEEGCGINAMYLPSLIPLIIKCVNLLATSVVRIDDSGFQVWEPYIKFC